MLGGDCGGASGQDDVGHPRANGAAGGQTRVELWDGTTNTGVFWTAQGAAGGDWYVNTNMGTAGANSAYGLGGAGGTSSTDDGDAATGYGAGGGGGYGGGRGGRGGYAASTITITDYNIDALVAPKLVITIGAGGVDSGGSTTSGGAGSKGVVKYTPNLASDTPADVVPLKPTATGSFAKAGGVAGTFPALGAGLWVIDTGAANTYMQLGSISLGDGSAVFVGTTTSCAFVSSAKPTYSGGANARTIYYAFYSMGSWG